MGKGPRGRDRRLMGQVSVGGGEQAGVNGPNIKRAGAAHGASTARPQRTGIAGATQIHDKWTRGHARACAGRERWSHKDTDLAITETGVRRGCRGTHMSVWHRAFANTLTRTSPFLGGSTMISSTLRGCLGPQATAALHVIGFAILEFAVASGLRVDAILLGYSSLKFKVGG